MVHRRQIDGNAVLFGNQGALWGNALTWWDHETGSVWSQPMGEALAGPNKGKTLDLIPSTLTTWDAWRTAHPDTLALDAATNQSRFKLDDMAIVLEIGNDPTAFPVPAIREFGVVNEIVDGAPVAVLFDPADDDRWVVFSRLLDDQIVTLAIRNESLLDVESGSTWDPVTGRALAGPLKGLIMDLLPGFTSFPQDFLSFWPEGRIWEP